MPSNLPHAVLLRYMRLCAIMSAHDAYGMVMAAHCTPSGTCHAAHMACHYSS
jgi:hypothetical protein